MVPRGVEMHSLKDEAPVEWLQSKPGRGDMSAEVRLAGIELGGTKSIAILTQDGETVETVVRATLDPQRTLGELRRQLDRWHSAGALSAIGIASFGPLQLDPGKPDFGTMLATPKAGWTGAKIAQTLTADLDCPWAIDTDVNGAALAEYRHGAGEGCSVLCYVTVGTGVGGGVLIDGRSLHGAMHPELGHLRLRRAPNDHFAGACPFHGDCIEGLVSGPALTARFGADASALSDADPRWRDVGSDVAELCAAILLTTASQRIIFGGSVMIHRPFLLPLVRELLVDRWGSYLPFLTRKTAEQIICPAGLGTNAGPLGAIALASTALTQGAPATASSPGPRAATRRGT